MILGPRLCCSTSAATVAPATLGAPSTGVSPPSIRTSPSCTIVPTSPAILPISSTSSGTTRYCRPPVLMTANIVLFLRVQSRPRTRPGRLLLQSLWVQFPRDRVRTLKAAQKQTARERSRAGCATYSHWWTQVKANWPENRPNVRDLGVKRHSAWRMGSSEWHFAYSLFATSHSPFAPHATNGFPICCPCIPASARGKMAEDTLTTTTGIGRHGAARLPSVDVDSFNVELKD